MLEAEFNTGTTVVKVDYYACSREEHQNDGFHYHCVLKLTDCKKWLSVKNRIVEKYGIQVNINEKHNFYLSVYRSICKSDQEVGQSENHPPGFLTAACSKTKNVRCRISCCLCYKKEVHRRKFFLWCYKEVKKFDQPVFSRAHWRKGYHKLPLAPCYC